MNLTPDNALSAPKEPNTSIQQTALELASHGLSVIPISIEGDGKKAARGWKQAQSEIADQATITKWFTGQVCNLAVVSGAVSGNLIMVEVEGRAKDEIKRLRQLAEDSGLGELWAKLARGWVEGAPSGGVHFFLRCSEAVPGNTVLARNENKDILAETRGEGGYTVVAPSRRPLPNGDVGKWERIYGGPSTLPTASRAELEQFFLLFQSLNRYEQPAPQAASAPPFQANAGTRPGDDYENKTTWDDILTPHGWVKVTTRGSTIYWRRPGKSEGISATTGNAADRDRLYVFSTSTDFEPEIPYTKFAAYALLNHGGDYQAAARQLGQEGYGEQSLHFSDLHAGEANTGEDEEGEEGGGVITPQVYTPKTFTKDAYRNETALSEWLVQEIAGRFFYCPELNLWHQWDGTVWKQLAADRAEVVETARGLFKTLPAGSKRAINFRNKTLGQTSVVNIVKAAQTKEAINKRAELLNADPYLICHAGGMTNLKTGQTSPARPEYLFTKKCPYAPQPTPTPMWDRFLAQTFNGDMDLIDYLQQMLGSALVGEAPNIALFCYGTGANGKTVLFNVVEALLGRQEWVATLSQEFLNQKTNAHFSEGVKLKDARLAIAHENNEGDQLDEAKLKLITGGDTITARQLYQQAITFKPKCTLVLVGNNKPIVKTGGESLWRRLKVIPFRYTVPPEERQANLDQQLIKEEGNGIMQWLVDGAQKWLASNKAPTIPQVVEDETREYSTEQDKVGEFIAEVLTLTDNSNDKIPRPNMRTYLNMWSQIQGYARPNTQTWEKLLERLRLENQCEVYKTSGAYVINRVRVNPQWAKRMGWAQDDKPA